MILQMVYIRRSFGRSENPLQNTANQVNLTVFLISLLYLSSNGIFSIYYIITSNRQSFIYTGSVFLMVRFTLPLLNAALFPTILILRKPDLRAKYQTYILSVCCLPLIVFRRVCLQVQRRRGHTEI
jgi:hypothetical protein